MIFTERKKKTKQSWWKMKGLFTFKMTTHEFYCYYVEGDIQYLHKANLFAQLLWLYLLFMRSCWGFFCMGA